MKNFIIWFSSDQSFSVYTLNQLIEFYGENSIIARTANLLDIGEYRSDDNWVLIRLVDINQIS